MHFRPFASYLLQLCGLGVLSAHKHLPQQSGILKTSPPMWVPFPPTPASRTAPSGGYMTPLGFCPLVRVPWLTQNRIVGGPEIPLEKRPCSRKDISELLPPAWWGTYHRQISKGKKKKWGLGSLKLGLPEHLNIFWLSVLSWAWKAGLVPGLFSVP